MAKVFARGDIELGAAPAKEPEVVIIHGATAEEPPPKAAPDDQPKATPDDEPKAVADDEPAAEASGSQAGADVASRAAALFLAIDLNGNGPLSLSELATFLGPDAKEVRCGGVGLCGGVICRVLYQSGWASLSPGVSNKHAVAINALRQRPGVSSCAVAVVAFFRRLFC